MSFIDSTYFTGEINVPGAADDLQLGQAIIQYEKEILIKLLGYKLYSLLIADLSAGLPQNEPYISLVNGAEFTHVYSGREYSLKWNGLKNTDLISLIAYYVFYKYVERDITRLYGSGVSMADEGNGWKRVNPVNKLCAAWERMRELYGIIPAEYKRCYDGAIFGSELESTFNIEPSAYNYLFANKTDFPDWIFTPQWNINAFGI